MKPIEYKSLNKVVDKKTLWRSRIALFGILVVVAGLFSPVGRVRAAGEICKIRGVTDPSFTTIQTCTKAGGNWILPITTADPTPTPSGTKVDCLLPGGGFASNVDSAGCTSQGGTPKPLGSAPTSPRDPTTSTGSSGSGSGGGSPGAGCWVTDFGCQIKEFVLSIIPSILLKVAAFILWLAGMILNFVINYTVVEMAAHINGGATSLGDVKALTGINIAWKVLRDLMNIAFIFLLVYEGILMIIGQSDIVKMRKFITGIVLAMIYSVNDVKPNL